MNIKCYIYLIFMVFPIKYCSGAFYIGATFDRNKRINAAILEYAVKKANENVLSESDIELGFMPDPMDYVNEFAAAESVCRLLESKNYAIIGPQSPSASTHVASICDAKEIPYIDTYMDIESKTSTINLYPSHETLSQLLIDVVNKYDWQDFVVLYEAPTYIKRIAPLLEYRNRKPGIVTIQPIKVNTSFRNELQKIKDMGSRSLNIIIECSIEHLYEILEQALQVGLFTPERNFIITNLDAQTIELEKFQYTRANITIFRIINPDASIQEFKNIYDLLEMEKDRCVYSCTPDDVEELSPTALQTSTALIYDAIMLLAEALKQLGKQHLETNDENAINCYNSNTWGKGSTVMNFMKISKFMGLTRMVELDRKGLRSNVEIDIMSLGLTGLINIGSYTPNITDRISFKKLSQDDIDPNVYRPIHEMTFKVIISVTDPYIMLKDSAVDLKGNERYEGFGIDLIDELSKLYGFKYILYELHKGEGYGSFDNQTKTWNGMIGMISNGSADLGITDLTINSERIKGIDFTPSFMNLGIALLYRKPTKEAPSTFSFMSPFSKSVWILLGAAYIAVSLCFFCLGRISASQWENRYPCIEEPTYLENQFTLNNSMWFAAGALLQQGSEIEPKAASIRLASSFWWFFTLIMVASYTANLATFLVIENKKSIINSVQDLEKYLGPDPENNLKFGAKSDGATFTFFKDSQNDLYKKMYNYMLANPMVMTKENKEGIDRVYNISENYAFLMESSSIEYETERKCNLTIVGDRLDDKNYGIGMRKDFRYHSQFSEGVLQLQEKGVLAGLQKKWWKERKGGGACSKDEKSEAVPLKYQNLQGVFLVLLFGSIFATFYGCIEALLLVYKKAKREKITFKEELIAELKFLMTCKGVKQVRHRKGSNTQYSGTSNQSNQSRYSRDTNSHMHGSNALLNME